MNLFQKIFLKLSKFILLNINCPDKIRDLIVWPIATRLFAKNFVCEINLSNQLKVRVGMEDMLNRLLLFYSPEIDAFWEPQTTRLTREICKDKNNIIIAGAHMGYILLEVAPNLRSNAKVFTFEPIDYLFNRSLENIGLNKLNNKIIIFNKALSDVSGRVFICEDNIRSFITNNSNNENGKKIKEIQAINLIDLQKEQSIDKIDFIFLDIEGYEFKVLSGAEAILREQRPDIIFEVSPKVLKNTKFDENEIYDFLKQFSYSLYLIDDNYFLNNLVRYSPKKIRLININSKRIDEFKNSSYYNVLAITDINKLKSLNCDIVE
jgi:FkbM family methyltransferase